MEVMLGKDILIFAGLANDQSSSSMKYIKTERQHMSRKNNYILKLHLKLTNALFSKWIFHKAIFAWTSVS